ncbi:MAG TPA: hypothetical protein LFW20_00615, partial [Rickettsia endosymbiont of Omalisus fontisbellaquei]|nr:hypothetical protein [Rickettsia endosymbiont of Omalisus fontisbellaquei]
PEYTVISWLGGSMTAGRAQWEQLAGKEVIIFPDNDESGMKAAYTISRIVNAANGYKKNVTIIDPKVLEFGDKVHNNILPEKWDLADKLPEGVNLDNIREAIINKRIQNLVQLSQKKISIESNKLSNIDGEKVQNIANRMVWQNNLIGHSSPSGEIKKNAIIEHGWQQKLSSSDAVSYMKYIAPGGTSRSVHEFLEYDHGFYQAILTSIAVNSELSDRKDLKLSDQISELQYSYSDKAKAFAGFYSVSETYLKYNKELAKTYLNSNEKTLLYKSLVRDFALLHQEQLGIAVRDLPVSYHEFMAKEIYQNISSYKANNGRGQNTDKLENTDKANITTKLYKTLGDNEMWKKLSKELMPENQNINNQSEYLKDNNNAVIQKQAPLNNSEIIKIVKQGMDDLRRHGTPTDINNAFVKYSTHGIEAGNDFIRHACQNNIEKKITDDLQIMENKYSGALTKEKELITVKDFKGVSYTNDDDYLKGIKQDENAMRYITENSDLGKKIQNVVQRVLQCQASNDLER